jgi:signal transduction histidine kinase
MALVDELRALPIFELFSEEQLVWTAERGEVVERSADTFLFRTGDVPDGFWVLLEGEIEISRRIVDWEGPVGSSDQPGAWAGMVPYVFEESQISARLPRDSRLLRLPQAVVREMVDVGFPIAKHLMIGVTVGTQRWQERVAERERMISLGRLSAGLAHELNNPAAATTRAADQLRDTVAAHEAAALEVACAAPGPDLAERLAGLRAEVAAAVESAPVLPPVERSDREEAVGEWLMGAGVEDGWEMASTIVDAGLQVDDLERLVPADDGDARAPLLRWLVASTESGALIREVEQASVRISELVKAVKEYSYLDRAEVSAVDVRRGIEDTLRVLRGKLGAIAVERDYDPDLPRITTHGGQLNQVWTNLLDNAVDAMGGSGTIRIGASVVDDRLVVTVADDGPGIPGEVVHRVFEPFFTTKGVGEGTGLGLDIARRIVDDARGELSVASAPGRTVFTVALPLDGPAGR